MTMMGWRRAAAVLSVTTLAMVMLGTAKPAAGASCPCSIWDNSTTPTRTTVFNEGSPIEVGAKFRSDEGGQITAFRFYKGPGTSGTHTGHLWTSGGALLATQVFDSESLSGWQQVTLNNPVTIMANTTYVVSVFSDSGDYISDHPYFTTAVDNPPLHALADGADGGNGVFNQGSSAFPTTPFDASNYWTDVVFEPDSTPPVISQLTAQPVTTTTQSVSWVTDEPATSQVDYGTSPDSLSANVTDGTLTTSHSLTLTGLSPNTTYFYRATSADALNNSATSPVGSDPPESFTTPAFAATDTTAADFGGGNGCSAVAHDTGPASGEVQLSPAFGAEFNDNALPAGWQVHTWNTGGTATVAGGVLTADGAFASPTALFAPGQSLEFAATFQSEHFQHVGFTVDFQDSPFWAIFSTGQPGTGLLARTNNNGVLQDDTIPGNWLGKQHLFRIDWLASQIVFSIDGNVVDTQNVSISEQMRPGISDFDVSTNQLSVDWMQMLPFAPSCTFVSQPFGAGANVQWSTLDAQTSAPAGTSVAFQTRTSQDATSWSPFVALNGDTIQSPNGRYLQYRAILSTTDDTVTPVVRSVAVVAAQQTADQTLPTTSMLVPANNAWIHGQRTLDASASDDTGVTKVEFQATGPGLNDAIVGTGTNTVFGWVGSWNTTGLPDLATYSLKSVAFDAANNSASSAPITVRVDNTPPSTSMIVPSNNAAVKGQVTVDASASDNQKVTRVEFRATGPGLNDALVGTGTSSQFGWVGSWNTTGRNGTYTLSSVAFDTAGNSTRSAPITVKVDNTPPTTSMLVPSNNASITGNATLDASANDNVGVTRVEFHATGPGLSDAVVGTGTNTRYGWIGSWNTSGRNGTYKLSSVAFDAAGNSGRSTAITVTVHN